MLNDNDPSEDEGSFDEVAQARKIQQQDQDKQAEESFLAGSMSALGHPHSRPPRDGLLRQC